MRHSKSLRLTLLFLILLLEGSALAEVPPPKAPKLDIRLTQKDYKTVPENF